MGYKVGLIVDKTSTEDNSQEMKHADLQKEATANIVSQILGDKYETEKIVADEKIIEVLSKKDFNIIFNLSTGNRGESRQSQIPAVLEMLGLPYVGSGVLAHALALNKAVAKQIFNFHKVPTPSFQMFYTGEEEIDQSLVFPLIVKPACEGSGFGIHKDSVVYNEEALLKKAKELLSLYQPPVLVEEFIGGREFTVGIIGNGKDKVILPIMEIDFEDIPEEYGRFYTFEVKNDWGDKTKYHCPAAISAELEKEIIKHVTRAFEALECRDFARIDVRVRDDEPYIIEINSLPGLQPVYSDLPKMANAAGIPYEELINRIFDEAIKRVKSNIKS
ncbi:MAG: D-alanine--D-alanine ligase family protein [Clostridia bacterium]